MAIQPEFSLAHVNLSICYQKSENIPRILLHSLMAIKYAKENELEILYQQQEMLDTVEKSLPDDLTLEQYIEDGLTFEHLQGAF